MSPVDLSRAISISKDAEFDEWLRANGRERNEVVVAIFNKASRKQAVTFGELQETALAHGWVDTQTKTIDAERYAIRFVPRRAGSNWSPTNRKIARKLLDEGRMTAAGIATLPDDL